jgi:hypothetical protein
MSNLVPVADMAIMADSIIKSQFYGFKTKEQVMAVMLVAQAENKHPATVVQEYDIIQGRPALKSQAMLARFQQAGGKVEWHEMSPQRVSGTFSHPAGGSLKVEWSIEMAKQAGLYREGSGWTKYPEDMLRSRAVSRGVRSVFPACILGHYSVEEVQEFDKPKSVPVEQPFTIEAEVVDHPYKLWIPNQEEPYSTYASKEEWFDGFNNLLAKIQNSPKLDDEAKQLRVQSLEDCNSDMLTGAEEVSK